VSSLAPAPAASPDELCWRRAGCCRSFERAGFEASVALTYQPSSCAELEEKAISQASFISRETESSNPTRATGESVANLTFSRKFFTGGLNEGSHANEVWASVCETMPGQEGSREQLTYKRTQE